MGFTMDLKQGCLKVPKEKLQSISKELGKLLTHKTMSCRKMAAILGATRSFLMAMPFLRAFTDQLVQFVKMQEKHGCDKQISIQLEVKNQVMEMAEIIKAWKGRTFGGKTPIRNLHSDSSQESWAGVDLTTPKLVQEFWRDQRSLHINVKELKAAINTVQSLAKKGEKVSLSVDNTVTLSYLRKGGGKIPSQNQIVRPFLKWCIEKQIILDLTLVKSAENLADGPSRWGQDRGMIP